MAEDHDLYNDDLYGGKASLLAYSGNHPPLLCLVRLGEPALLSRS